MTCVIEDITNIDPTEYDDTLSRMLAAHDDDVEAFMRVVYGFVKRRTSFFKRDGADKVLTKVQREFIPRTGGVKSGFLGAAKPAAKKAAVMQPKPSASEPHAAPAAAAPVPEAPAGEEVPSTSAAASDDAAQAPLDVPAAEDDEGSGEQPNGGNGLDLEAYSWTQTLSEVSVNVKVPPGTRGRDCDVSIAPKALRVGVKGAAPTLDGALHADVVPDECYWNCDGRVIEITMQKKDGMAWWSTIVKGEPEINTRKVQPENSKLDDLDRDTRQTVEKMMFDQRQKAMNKPTSDQMQQQEMLQKFMKAHPEMDFSNAKIM